MSASLIGNVLGKYRIVEKLASSDFADVYRGIQIGLDREVAIRVLPPALAADREMVKRFRRESQATAKLSHPNIITIYDSGEQSGLHFYVMEFLKAQSLADVLAAQGTLELPRALKIAQDVLRALAYCHEKQVAHHDLQPAHIKFDLRENAIVTDFGLAEEGGSALADCRQVVALLRAMLGDVPDELAGWFAVEWTSAKDMLAELKKVELKLKARKASKPTTQVSRAPVSAIQSSGSMSVEGSGFGSATTGVLASPRDRESLLRLLAITVPVFLVGLTCVLAAFGLLWSKRPPALLEQAREVDSMQATLSWRTAAACYSQVEYWPVTSTAAKLRTPRGPAMHLEHKHVVAGVKPDATYHFRFLFSYSASEDAETFASEVFDFTTRPEIQIFNIHVDEYPTKAVLTWETNLRTDTTVKYGRTDQYEDLRANPDQKSETIHSITLEALTPDTTYHYQVVASDPRGRGAPKPSEDLQFRTSQESGGTEDPKRNSLVALTKSYVDKLSRMTPDEREKLKASIMKFMDPKAELAPADKEMLLKTRTAPKKDDEFNNRLQLARAWFARLKEKKLDVDRYASKPRVIQTEYYTNALAGARRLDQFLKLLSEMDK